MPKPVVQVDFYRLGGAAVESVLPLIAAKCLGSGARLLVVAGDAGLRARISERLWAHQAGFLAHGEAGGAHDARQPILLSDAAVAGNGAAHIAFADGRWRQLEDDRFERAFLFVDPDNLEAARACWKTLGAREDMVLRSWTREGRGWSRLK